MTILAAPCAISRSVAIYVRRLLVASELVNCSFDEQIINCVGDCVKAI